MIKKTKTKTFDTDTATVVKKVCFGEVGDPAGYETTMYQTPTATTSSTRMAVRNPLQGGKHHVLLQVQGSCLDREQLTSSAKKSGPRCLLFFVFSGKYEKRRAVRGRERHKRRGGLIRKR